MKRKIVHFEIGCSNIDKASEFYTKVFDWKIKRQGNSAFIETDNTDEISGHINQLGPNDPQKYLTFYIETDSLDSDLKAIEMNGGKILVQPVTLPDGRSFAWFEDVAGNTIGLISPK